MGKEVSIDKKGERDKTQRKGIRNTSIETKERKARKKKGKKRCLT